MRTLLKGADILLRKENGYETLHGAYLGVDEAKIDYIGEEKPEKTYDLEKDMSGRLLAPGLINCHSHIAMTLMRGIGSGRWFSARPASQTSAAPIMKRTPAKHKIDAVSAESMANSR